MSYTEYNITEMKAKAQKYAERVLDLSNASGSNINLNDEFMMLKLDKSILQTMLNTANCDGLLAIFGLDTDNDSKQTLILVPCDNHNKALKYSGAAYKGAEAWAAVARNMKDIIYPTGSGTDIPTGITNAFKDVNM